MNNPLHFKTRNEFREWLSNKHQSNDGVWLLFGKTKELETLKASEALEEALCYGWIDGLMKRVDDISYVKYFSPRRKNSKWSDKNKALVEQLVLHPARNHTDSTACFAICRVVVSQRRNHSASLLRLAG